MRKILKIFFGGNPMFNASAIVPAKGHDFLKDLDDYTFSECLKAYEGYPQKVSLWRRCIKKLRTLVRKK